MIVLLREGLSGMVGWELGLCAIAACLLAQVVVDALWMTR
jgi:hypothetical protein